MTRTHALSVGVCLGSVSLVLMQLIPLVVSGQGWLAANVLAFAL